MPSITTYRSSPMALLLGGVVLLAVTGCAEEVATPSTEEERAAMLERIRPAVTLEELQSQPSPSPAAQPAASMQPDTASAEAVPPAAASGGSASAKALYDGACMVCHSTGAAGAPMLGDKAAWEPRYAAGMDALLTTSRTGKGVMPPNGASNYTEEQMREVIEFMLAEAGLI